MWKTFEEKVKYTESKIKIINCDTSKEYIIENIFQKISSFLNDVYSHNDNNNEDDEKMIFKEENNSNNYQNLKMKEIKYFEKLLEDETYKKYDKMYFFNFQRKKENYKLNLTQIQKYNNIPQYEIKKISEIIKYNSNQKNLHKIEI